jgi:DNA-binding protein HU-beta
MNKSDLVDAVAEAADLSKMSAARAVDAVVAAIGQALKNGDTVALAGFGTFQAKLRPARTGRNPKTGEPIDIPEAKIPAFKSGKGLKDLLK